MSEHVLTLSCADRRGIVHAVTGMLLDAGCNIVDSQQFGDRGTGRFFMRVHVSSEDSTTTRDGLADAFVPIATAFGMDWQIHDAAVRSRLLVMVSRLGHCLNDLLYRQSIGALPAAIVGVVSNHADFEPLATSYGVPFHHVPVTRDVREEADARLLELVDRLEVDLVVLARYMQVIGPAAARVLRGRAINIHHSFLPSFKGAEPYRQAHERGVKLIGATAHYVTEELDEGPIIEQEVQRVDHGLGPERLAAVGRDVECVTLARAVQWHVEHRVLLNGRRTVVFR
jgi:formyltetrahydrofolate deformylase